MCCRPWPNPPTVSILTSGPLRGKPQGIPHPVQRTNNHRWIQDSIIIGGSQIQYIIRVDKSESHDTLCTGSGELVKLINGNHNSSDFSNKHHKKLKLFVNWLIRSVLGSSISLIFFITIYATYGKTGYCELIEFGALVIGVAFPEIIENSDDSCRNLKVLFVLSFILFVVFYFFAYYFDFTGTSIPLEFETSVEFLIVVFGFICLLLTGFLRVFCIGD